MTKQEAIAVLQQRIDVIEDDQAYSMLTKSMYKDGYRRIEAFKMAIAALNEAGSPTTQLDENGLARCNWCGPERIGWFSVQFWVRACYGKRKWMSVTQDWKKKVKYCPMCGRKLPEVDDD